MGKKVLLKGVCSKCNKDAVFEFKSANDLEVWDVVNEQISRSGIKRISWKPIFGETLTKVISGYYAEEFDADKTFETIKAILISKGFSVANNSKMFDNLKISVCARYAEIKSESKKIREVRQSKK